ncbi:MAG: helix-hairpin-helix domain-containing protein, partial [Thermoplasmatota archaeon]
VKLRKILDNSSDPNIKTMISADEKALDSVRRRLAGDTLKTKPQSDSSFCTSDSLEPKVTIHSKIVASPRLITPLPKFESSTTLPEFELVSPSKPARSVPPQELSFTSEELYEVEKVDVILPEFLEVTPKDTLQKPLETEITIKYDKTQAHDSSLPEWQPVGETQSAEPSVSHAKSTVDHIPEFERVDIAVNPEKVEKAVEWKPFPAKEETIEAPVEFTLVESPEPQLQKLSKKQERELKKTQKKNEKEAKRLKKLELKKLKREKRDKEREAKRIVKEQQDIQQTPDEKPSNSEPIIKVESPQIKVDLIAFKDLESIDEQTAELLYKNGYFSIENLKDATVDDLVQIRGIKRKLAKQIKKEIEQKTTIPEDLEFVPIKQKRSAKKPKEEPEDTAEWESYPVEKIVKKPSSKSACIYEEYTLYKRETGKYSGKKTTIHFFCKEKPDTGDPAQLPRGYQIAVNKKTGIPYLKKKK